jgi:NADPH-dependent 2,4-dienoyl-CoA reductase/sulfur reductase-like enzyme
MEIYDVVIIGGGPAGLACSLEAGKRGLKVLLIEREARLGGILKQCLHDGFGLLHFKEKLTGPEYAERFISEMEKVNIGVTLLSFVTKMEKTLDGFTIIYVNESGIHEIQAKNLVLATGCRERTRNQVFIPGDRGCGILTAGTAQHLINILGISPVQKAVILGSGDIGLIMARRLTLEGAKVEGVYEVKKTPSGLTRNIHQCLYDYDIPLHLSHTVTRIIGRDRVTSVEVSEVDEAMQPVKGTERIVECDGLILAVGLIPENELAESLDVRLDPKTKGPVVDQNMMTMVDRLYACGNCQHVHDLVDYVTESAERAGRAVTVLATERQLIDITAGNRLLYAVPQTLNLKADLNHVIVYFRAKDNYRNASLIVSVDGIDVMKKKYAFLMPPEMERLEIDFSQYQLKEDSKVGLRIEADIE